MIYQLPLIPPPLLLPIHTPTINLYKLYPLHLPCCQYANAHSPARPSDLPPCVAAVATSSPRSNCDIRGPSWPDCRAALKDDRAWKYKQSIHHIKFLDGIWIMKHGIRRRILFLYLACDYVHIIVNGSCFHYQIYGNFLNSTSNCDLKVLSYQSMNAQILKIISMTKPIQNFS